VTPADLIRCDGRVEAECDLRFRRGFQDVPHLRLAPRVAVLLRHCVTRMDLDREVFGGEQELYQDGGFRL